MVRKVIVELVDDIDGSTIDGTGEHIKFAVDGISYEIDLSPMNAKEFRRHLDFYIQHATHTGGRRQLQRTKTARAGRKTTKAIPDREKATAIRDWARANSFDVGHRGRISDEIREAYNAATR